MTPEGMTVVKKRNMFHILAIIVGLLISLPLGTYLFFTVQTFFAGATDEIPRDVSITHITGSSATIAWTTGKETLSVVEYGLSADDLNLFAPELEAKKDHQIQLTLLKEATTYYFQIESGDEVYDNAGVPWTFTTKTANGSDQREDVKGISTKLTPIITKIKEQSTSTKISTNNCTVTDCDIIKQRLGNGCSAKDYFQCISKSKEATPTPTLPLSYNYGTPIPTPTSVHIDSNLCELRDLYTLNDDCTTWAWTSIDANPKVCREAFDRYILQCQSESFSSSVESDDYQGTYVMSNASYTSKTLPLTPTPGDTIYCRLKAVDEEGSADGESHATSWVNAEKTCQ